ncbi:hypothetical protein [Paraburkholderia sp. D1E]|uniref:hypothetical protein n=1 Tax=Paraburkholderia sp. D1E TaxID=3461398 RepID=UPI004045E8A5
MNNDMHPLVAHPVIIAESKRLATDIGHFLDKCGLKRDRITPISIAYALEAAYQPLPCFWRDLTYGAVLIAVEVHAPGFLGTILQPDGQASDFAHTIELELKLRTSDELNAELLLSLSDKRRPTALRAAYRWLLQELTTRGEHEEAGHLKTDGLAGAKSALDLVAARDGRKFETDGMRRAMNFSHATALAEVFLDVCDE